MDDTIRQKIVALLDQHRIMTIATLRPDGWPQATTVATSTKASHSISCAVSTARRPRILRTMTVYR